MSEEIKEILDNFEKYEARYRLRNETQFIITHREIQILLDYITNSQEENEYSNHCNEELRKKITNLEYKIERLEEDNKQLKDLCDKYEEEHSTTFIEWQKDIKANKKAIEYINKHCVNEKVSKEVGYKCYTMADTNELEYIMKKLGDDYE